MKPRTLLALLAMIGLALAATVASQETRTATAQAEPADDDPPSAPGEPGEHHEHLGRQVGDWDLTLRVWSSPQGEPLEVAGTATVRWILGGRFLHTVYRSELFGEPFEAWYIEGYDDQSSEYVGTWRDTQGSYTVIYRGKCDSGEAAVADEEAPAGAIRTLKATITDPASGEKLKLEGITTLVDEDTFTFESVVVLSAEDRFTNMEMTARRKRDGA